MKIILSITLLFTTLLLANYAFSDDKTVKIDMHGGKSEMMTNKKGFSDKGTKNFKGLQGFSIKNPTEPKKPKKEKVPALEDIQLK
jgi:hypothetical protein